MISNAPISKQISMKKIIVSFADILGLKIQGSRFREQAPTL